MSHDWTRDEIELAFVREFASGGVLLGGSVSPTARRERIRLEIYRHELHDEKFRDSDMTYGQAYRHCFKIALDMRRISRDPLGRPAIAQVIESLDDEAIDEDEFCECPKLESTSTDVNGVHWCDTCGNPLR